VGGTFTDLVARAGSGRLRACKVPTTPANLSRGVLNGLLAVRPATGVPASVAHGTTVVTNAIVEGRGARVGLVATRGFRDVAALAPHFAHLSVSSEINAEFREYERTSTTVLNAAVMPLASRYLDELVAALGREARGAVLHLLHSAGGMMSAEAARARPLAMAAS